MKSIMQNTKTCFICGKKEPLHLHHVFYGNANRKQSDKWNCVIWLCPEHHTGEKGVHKNRVLDIVIKRLCQTKFEELHSHEKFMRIFGKNYL